LLVRFLREHRSEWADYGVDVYSAACLKASPYAVPCARPGGFPSSQVILPLAHTVEHEEVSILSVYTSLQFLYWNVSIFDVPCDNFAFPSLVVLGGSSAGGPCILPRRCSPGTGYVLVAGWFTCCFSVETESEFFYFIFLLGMFLMNNG